MIAAMIADIVDFARRKAALVVIVALALALAAGILAGNRLVIDTSHPTSAAIAGSLNIIA